MPLADGPAMYFGGTIMTFSLPVGAFIVIAITLCYLFRSEHSGPKLKYLSTASFTSVGTREPGAAPAPPVIAAGPQATAGPQTTAGRETTVHPESAQGAKEPEE